jgi:hypothetical protein
VTGIVEKGIDMLKLGNSIKKPYYDNNVMNIAMESSRKDLYIIGDVRDYKSRLAVTAGPQAVKDLSEPEDIESNQIKSYDASPADAVEYSVRLCLLLLGFGPLNSRCADAHVH